VDGFFSFLYFSRQIIFMKKELSRLRKKGVINKETFMKAMDEWGL